MGVKLHQSSVKITNSFKPRWSIALLLAGFVLGTFLPSLVFAAPRKASARAGEVVISEFRTTGPGGGYDEFVELFNRTNETIPIDGWKIKKSSGCGGVSSTPLVIIDSGVSLAPGQRYLIGHPLDYTGTVDQKYTSSSSSVSDDGGIALLDSTDGIVDQVGMCITTEYLEKNPLSPLSGSSDQGYQRGENGCVDTNNNVADFALISPSDPQNSTAIPIKCLRVINVTSATSNGVKKEGDAIAISVQFSSNVDVTGSPTLLLETGTTDRTAAYVRGSGSDTLIFRYIVQNGDVSGDLDYVASNSLSLNGGSIIGAVGNADLILPKPGSTGSLAANKNIVIDNQIAPSVISFTRYDHSKNISVGKYTNADTLGFRVTFSEPVLAITVDTADFIVTGISSPPSVSVVVVPVNGSVYDITISGGNLAGLNGTVGLNLSSSQNITDVVGGVGGKLLNQEPAIDETYIVDNKIPTVTINQHSGQDDPANKTPVVFKVVFSEKIDTSTFTIDKITQNGIPASLITWSIADSGDHTTFTLSADRISENGTIKPSIAADQVKDLAGNENIASTSTSTDNIVTFNDNVAPTVTINQAASQTDPTSALPIEFKISFSEPIISSIFTTSDITQTGTATGVSWALINSGDDQNFTLRATSAGYGTIAPFIAANKVQDIVGNDNLASTSTDNIVTYKLPDTSTPTSTPTITSTPTVTSTHSASLTLLINEVAWAGTEASSNDEWIELYNASSFPIDLSAGWKLISSDGGVDIALSGVIYDHAYFLLERTDDATILDITADQIYAGSLSNEGEYLKLLAPDGRIVDTANNTGGGWDAGSASPGFYSMERNGIVSDGYTAWISNTGVVRNGIDAENNPINGTPRQANWALSVTITPSPVRTSTPIAPTRTPTPYPFQSVVLNEVLPRPGSDWNQDGVVDMNDEFIEIINRGVSTVSLSGWRLDDEYNLGSSPYTLPNVSLGAGERIAIFGYTSHISLSDGGDTVRLLKSDGSISDAVTYTVVKGADQSWCRLPENGFWNSKCFPTPNQENAAFGEFPARTEEQIRASCLVPDTAPDEILLIECGLLGMDIVDDGFWENNLPTYWLTGHTKYATWFR